MKYGDALFITGTDTGVGKTMVTGYLQALYATGGYRTIPYKPIQSGGIRQGQQVIAEDVAFYQSLSSLPYEQEMLCTYCMEPAVSPHLAAKQVGMTMEWGRIDNHLTMLRKHHDLVFVEGAGGLAVPLAKDERGLYMTTDLIARLQLPLLLVTQPGLGTINHTVLTVAYARQKKIPILGLIINRMPENPSEMHIDNVQMMSELTGLPILGTLPEMDGTAMETLRSQQTPWPNYIDMTMLMTRLQQVKEEPLQIKQTEGSACN
ncbi:dethiobiotin synthase [Aneurinibacillus sp. REN35]|uniref:dethiobiotin synthase n=1 Tax=Aneurinibacillus sp. REN35 TaxID=3237286 RepID=UPI0035299555